MGTAQAGVGSGEVGTGVIPVIAQWQASGGFTPTWGVSSQVILQGKETHLNFLSNGRGEDDPTFVQEQHGYAAACLWRQ